MAWELEPRNSGSSGGLERRSVDHASIFSPPLRSMTNNETLKKVLATPVNFRDVTLANEPCIAEGNESDLQMDSEGSEGGGSPSAEFGGQIPQLVKTVSRTKQVIIMVGLPARGKTFLSNKIKSYLTWLGHETQHFNVGTFRRKEGDPKQQDASFFDKDNDKGMEARHRALLNALDEMMRWLNNGSGQVAIFDATNTTKARRSLLREVLHGRAEYLCLESICTDQETLDRNYKNKLLYSPDYKDMDEEIALRDFKERITKYEQVYEPLDDRSFHFIKLIDMVTGRGYLDINRISGYIPGKLVFYLMQINRSGLGNQRRIWLTRHGQSEYNRTERLGGNSSISSEGEEYAQSLPDLLLSRLPEGDASSLIVWTSTLKRTIQTARHIPFPKLRWKALDEIDAGICDGLTYHEVAEKMPEEYAARQADKLRYRYPSGESYQDCIQRLEPVIIEVERQRESVCIVAHQAILRVIYGYFMNVSPDQIPTLPIPLHTLIELTPRPDGTMHVDYIPWEPNREGTPDPTPADDQWAVEASDVAAVSIEKEA